MTAVFHSKLYWVTREFFCKSLLVKHLLETVVWDHHPKGNRERDLLGRGQLEKGLSQLVDVVQQQDQESLSQTAAKGSSLWSVLRPQCLYYLLGILNAVLWACKAGRLLKTMCLRLYLKQLNV